MSIRFGVLALSVATAQGAFAAEKADKPAGKMEKGKPAAKMNPKQVEHGKYLVTVIGCGDCHTAHVFNKEFGAMLPDDAHMMLAGHPNGAPEPAADPMNPKGPPDAAIFGPSMTSFKFPFGIVYAANLTPDEETGLGKWTEEMFIKAIRTGKHLGGAGRPILPPMPWPAFAQASDEDLKAIFAYLHSIPAIKNAVPEPKIPPPAMEEMTNNHNKMMKSMMGGKK